MKPKSPQHLLNKIRLVVYRINQKGLEVFLMPTDGDVKKDHKFIDIDGADGEQLTEVLQRNVIELDNPNEAADNHCKTIAVEGEWHDIPSIRKMLRSDIAIVKDTIKDMVPGIEQGAFYAVKEAVKEVMPDEYRALKELKEIIIDRNSTKYI